MTFETAYAAYWPLAVSVARRVLRDREAAEDAAGEALLRIWRNRDHITDWPGYIVTAARRVALDARRHRAYFEWAHLDTVAPFLTARSRPDAWPDVTAALRQLPPRQRVALVAFAAGYSREETAAAMGTTAGTVGTWINRARKRLRLILDGGPLPQAHRPRLPASEAISGRYTDRRREQYRRYQERAKTKREAA